MTSISQTGREAAERTIELVRRAADEREDHAAIYRSGAINAVAKADADLLRKLADSLSRLRAEQSGDRWSFARRCVESGWELAFSYPPNDDRRDEVVSAKLDELARKLADAPRRAARSPLPGTTTNGEWTPTTRCVSW